MRIGVVALQGDVSEHLQMLERAFSAVGIPGTTIEIRRATELEQVQAAILPGGESTTIGKLLVHAGLHAPLKARAEEGMPLLGTCAGCILMAKEGDVQVEETETQLLSLMDMSVNRNAFGRQKDSFEAEVAIQGWDKPVRGVFIRAPAILKVWGKCQSLSQYEGVTVVAREGNRLATTFHPELTGDSRLHEWLVRMV